MNNDLISREDLKKHKFTTTIYNGIEPEDIEVVPVASIDNAQPVEFPESITIKCDMEEDKQKLLSALRNARVTRIVEEERPTGHWKASGFNYSRRYAWCICSNCGKTTRIYLDDNDFCCIADIRNKAVACLFCGADMRGGRE